MNKFKKELVTKRDQLQTQIEQEKAVVDGEDTKEDNRKLKALINNDVLY